MPKQLLRTYIIYLQQRLIFGLVNKIGKHVCVLVSGATATNKPLSSFLKNCQGIPISTVLRRWVHLVPYGDSINSGRPPASWGPIKLGSYNISPRMPGRTNPTVHHARDGSNVVVRKSPLSASIRACAIDHDGAHPVSIFWQNSSSSGSGCWYVVQLSGIVCGIVYVAEMRGFP